MRQRLPHKTPFLLLLALATASVAYLLLTSRRRHHDDDEDDDRPDLPPMHVDDLLLTQEDVSDDVTVQVKNGRSQESQEEDEEDYDVVPSTMDADEEENAVDAVVDEDESTEQKSETVSQDQELIRQEARNEASRILRSIPEIPLVHECLREVEAAESSATPVDRSPEKLAATEDSALPTAKDMTDIPTIYEEPSFVPIATTTNPYEPSTTTKKIYPKTPPVKLHPTKQEEEDAMEPPTDTTDYNLLSSYWKQKSQKHAFSPPIVASVTIEPSSKPVHRKKDSPTVEEEAAAAAAAAGLVVAGVVNVLDHVLLSPATSSPSSRVPIVEEETTRPYADEEEDVPILNETTMEEEADANDPHPTEEGVSDDAENVHEEEEEPSDDPHLILPSGSEKSGADSENSSSDKSSGEDYVKIVKMASGDPMTESELFARPVEVVASSSSLGGMVVGEGGSGGGDSGRVPMGGALVSDEFREQRDLGEYREDGIQEEEVGDSSPKGKGKSRSRKKKKGKKK